MWLVPATHEHVYILTPRLRRPKHKKHSESHNTTGHIIKDICLSVGIGEVGRVPTRDSVGGYHKPYLKRNHACLKAARAQRKFRYIDNISVDLHKGDNDDTKSDEKRFIRD